MGKCWLNKVSQDTDTEAGKLGTILGYPKTRLMQGRGYSFPLFFTLQITSRL